MKAILGRDRLKADANAYAGNPAAKNALAIVRKHPQLSRAGGWLTFKMRLWTILNPGSPYPGREWDVPKEFIYAMKIANGWTRVDAYRQVILGGR